MASPRGKRNKHKGAADTTNETRSTPFREGTGIVLACVTTFLALSLLSYHRGDPSFNHSVLEPAQNLAGQSGAYLADLFYQVLGWPALVVPLMLGFIGLRMFRQPPLEMNWDRIVSVPVFFAVLCTLITMVIPPQPLNEGLPAGAGGSVGILVGRMMLVSFGFWGSLVLLIPLQLISFLLMTRISVTGIISNMQSIQAEKAARELLQEEKQLSQEKLLKPTTQFGSNPIHSGQVEPKEPVAEKVLAQLAVGGQQVSEQIGEMQSSLLGKIKGLGQLRGRMRRQAAKRQMEKQNEKPAMPQMAKPIEKPKGTHDDQLASDALEKAPPSPLVDTRQEPSFEEFDLDAPLPKLQEPPPEPEAEPEADWPPAPPPEQEPAAVEQINQNLSQALSEASLGNQTDLVSETPQQEQPSELPLEERDPLLASLANVVGQPSPADEKLESLAEEEVVEEEKRAFAVDWGMPEDEAQAQPEKVDELAESIAQVMAEKGLPEGHEPASGVAEHLSDGAEELPQDPMAESLAQAMAEREQAEESAQEEPAEALPPAMVLEAEADHNPLDEAQVTAAEAHALAQAAEQMQQSHQDEAEGAVQETAEEEDPEARILKILRPQEGSEESAPAEAAPLAATPAMAASTASAAAPLQSSDAAASTTEESVAWPEAFQAPGQEPSPEPEPAVEAEPLPEPEPAAEPEPTAEPEPLVETAAEVDETATEEPAVAQEQTEQEAAFDPDAVLEDASLLKPAMAEEPADEEPAEETEAVVAPAEESSSEEQPAEELPTVDRMSSFARAKLDPAERWPLPGKEFLALADPTANVVDESDLNAKARQLEAVLGHFKVKGQIVDYHPGPVVTTFELDPAPGLKAAKVVGLADDLARSISALSVRVAGNIPGKSVIGIEVPNDDRQTVYLREVLESEKFRSVKSPLAVALGSDINGDPVVANIAKMPHLLVAGTTGSGKSVAVNAMICSVLFHARPDQVRFLMVDPKMLELSIYEGIPHLLAPVVTEVNKAATLLKWAVHEMEERYRLMSEMGVRNLSGYNEKVEECLASGEQPTRRVKVGFDPETGQPVERDEPIPLEKKPLIVIVIDELADLMVQVGKEVEPAIARLAQMARAAGLHLILATQRPSVDVITGLIKANFPTRLAFQVSSRIDSRTILDAMGAERLLGMGDGLYLPPGTSHLQRIHAPFVADKEVHALVKHWKQFGSPDYDESVLTPRDDDDAGPVADMAGGAPAGGGGSDYDEFYDQAAQLVIRQRKVSTSMVQRHFKIGYNRAARIVEQMEEDGLISSPNHQGKREVLAPEQPGME
uniref:Putative DNA translocase FtsK n=1 Tax=Magnetococcus massalia (strain MO-1) TaxID=451514 RepID=A0A1S7LJL1_MAGMO|nr:Putative DNA translocase FtsK [Candidatus Magnetococcus massalia]